MALNLLDFTDASYVLGRSNESLLWCCLAGSLVKLKRHREAIDCFGRAIEIKPDSHTPWYWRGRVIMELKRSPEEMISLELAFPKFFGG